MDVRELLADWPVCRQVTGSDRTGRGRAVKSSGTEEITARTENADRAVRIEGDPESPVSRGRLGPEGSATPQPATAKRPGRPALPQFLAEYRKRAGITAETGTEVRK